MSTKKKILIGIPLLVIVALVIAFLYIDQIAKAAVEKAGTQAMGVPTSVDSISLKPFQGEASIRGLEISNPTGFKTPYFMHLAACDAALEVDSLLEDQIVVHKIELDGIELYLEKTKEGANYEVILENMKKGEEAPPPTEGGKKLLVQMIVIKDIVVHADVRSLGQKVTTLDVKIDEIKLENVGSDSGSGVVTSELMATIVKATLAAVLEQGVKLPVAIAEDLGTGLAGLGKSGVKVTVKVAGKVIGGVEDVIGGAAKGVVRGVQKVFGSDDPK